MKQQGSRRGDIHSCIIIDHEKEKSTVATANNCILKYVFVGLNKETIIAK